MKPTYTDGFFSLETHGFLPLKDPLPSLPEKYKSLQYIIVRIPYLLSNDNNIIQETLSMYIYDKTPDLTNEIKNETDPFLIQALFRAYSFISSAYILEPSYFEYKLKGNYGKAREILPKVLAVPLHYLANKLGIQPWLDYCYSYVLGNYFKINEAKGLNWRNLQMACKFTNSEDEVGLIMLHVYLNELSKDLICSIKDTVETLNTINSENINRSFIEQSLVKALELNYKTMKEINNRKREIWVASNYTKYNDFKFFLLRDNNEIFKNGIVYEGVSETPIKFNGEIQDVMITMQDLFSGIYNYYNEKEVKDYFYNLSYNPHCIRDFLQDLQKQMSLHNLFNHLVRMNNKLPLIFLLGIVAEIFKFRFRQYTFIKKKMIDNQRYLNGDERCWIPSKLHEIKRYYQEIKEKITSPLCSFEQNLLNTIDDDMHNMELFDII